MSDPNQTLVSMGRFEWERLVRRTPLKPLALKALAFTLATYAESADGTSIYPGVTRLTDDLWQDERTVRRNLEILERVGLIYKRSNGSSVGRRGGMASEYQLSAPKDVQLLHETDPDELLLFASEIQGGIRPAFPTWIEKHPRKRYEKKRCDQLSQSPGIHDRTPDIQPTTPGIQDTTAGGDARPPITTPEHPSSDHPEHGCGSLRSPGDSVAANEEEEMKPFNPVSVPFDIQAEMNRQAEALRNKFPQESW